MKAKIKEKKEIADGTILVVFDLLGEEITFKPGQYFFVTLINPPFNDDNGLTRHFTILNSPAEKGIIAMATRIRESAFKRSLKEMPVGSEVEIKSIQGAFVLPEDINHQFVFIAGGIGITPFISMLRFIKDNNLPYKVTLIYSNRNKKSAAFFEELEQTGEDNPNIKVIFTMTQDEEWFGEKRRIDEEFIKNYISDDLNAYTYFISGPEAMVENINKVLIDSGIDEKNIRKEIFSGY